MKNCSRTFIAVVISAMCVSHNLATAAPETIPQSSVVDKETLLGPGDSVTLATPEIEELDKRALTVGDDGLADVPLIGQVKASGLTPREFAEQIKTSLRRLYLHPLVSIASVDVKSRPVSVLGAVNTPGVQQADGRKRLMEVLSLAGGLRQDAGPRIQVTRLAANGGLPETLFPHIDGGFQTVAIPVSDLFEAKRPEENFPVQSGDVITVPKARLVYVVGDVKKAGGFVVGEHDNLTVLKALALAEGIQSTADSSHARILRATDDKSDGRPFNVKKLLSGQTADIALRPDDVLFIPSSATKKAAVRVMEAALQTGTGIAIWH